MDFATPSSDVSAFCRASISNVVPDEFWGKGVEGQGNKRIIMQYIDQFVKMRKFETLSPHAVTQRIKVKFAVEVLDSHWD